MFFINETLLLNGYNTTQFTQLLFHSNSDIFNIITQNEHKLLQKIQELITDQNFIQQNLETYLQETEQKKRTSFLHFWQRNHKLTSFF